MWSNDRLAYRTYFYQAWHKHLKKEIMTPLEDQIVTVIAMHPEYHFIFEDESLKERDYFPELGETNPFLHLSLHLGLREQLATDRPQGIRAIFEEFCRKSQDPHQAKHGMMEQMAEMMFQSSKGQVLDDKKYLQGLRALIPNS